MYDYHLKFADEAEALSVLFDGETPKFRNIDVIGVIYEHTGKTLNTEEGYIPETVPMDGWHVNVRHPEEVEEFAPYIVTPETPIRVWA